MTVDQEHTYSTMNNRMGPGATCSTQRHTPRERPSPQGLCVVGDPGLSFKTSFHAARLSDGPVVCVVTWEIFPAPTDLIVFVWGTPFSFSLSASPAANRTFYRTLPDSPHPAPSISKASSPATIAPSHVSP